MYLGFRDDSDRDAYLEDVLRLNMRRGRHDGWMPLGKGSKVTDNKLKIGEKKSLGEASDNTRAAGKNAISLPREYPITRGRFTMCVLRPEQKLDPANVPTSR